MVRNSPSQTDKRMPMNKITSSKRAREKALIDLRKQKGLRREEAKNRKANAPPRPDNEDPDIAGIVPGPQPLPDWMLEDENRSTEKP